MHGGIKGMFDVFEGCHPGLHIWPCPGDSLQVKVEFHHIFQWGYVATKTVQKWKETLNTEGNIEG